MCGDLEPGVDLFITCYLSFSDTTGPVGRNLGELASEGRVHGGAGDSLDECSMNAQSLLEIRLEGPACEEDVAAPCTLGNCAPPGGVTPGSVPETIHCSSVWELTPFSRRCADIWVQWHGRRFCIYTKTRPNMTKDQVHSDRAVLRRQRQALDDLYRSG